MPTKKYPDTIYMYDDDGDLRVFTTLEDLEDYTDGNKERIAVYNLDTVADVEKKYTLTPVKK